MRLLSTNAEQLQEIAAAAIAIGRELGADHAVATVGAHAAINVTARAGQTDVALRDAGQGLTLTLYRGARAGSASTAALDDAAIQTVAREAFAMAELTGQDPDGLPAALEEMATDALLPPIDAPSGCDPARLREMALEGDALLRGASTHEARIDTMTASARTSEGAMALATSAGFCRGQTFTHHNVSLVALAHGEDGAVNDYAESTDRRFDRLQPIPELASAVVARARDQLGARSVSAQGAPVLFEARAASALIGDLVGALSGQPQHRGATFLPDALGKRVAADHLDLLEDPLEPFGLASGGFDGEGIAGRKRAILRGGEVEGLFLGLRSARQLGMTSTGNAGGPWNLRLVSRDQGGSFEALCRTMERGLVVRRLHGGALDRVSGNWTFAVTGTWVEDGAPAYPVTDVTVGGDMRDMLREIVAVGEDVYRNGAIRTGSILIEKMQIGGAS